MANVPWRRTIMPRVEGGHKRPQPDGARPGP
jgi:hypothetical protein